jgi:hypothetical protein
MCNLRLGNGHMCTKHYLSSKGPIDDAKYVRLVAFNHARIRFHAEIADIHVLREELMRIREIFIRDIAIIDNDEQLRWDDARFQRIRLYENHFKQAGTKNPIIRYTLAKQWVDEEDIRNGNRRPVADPEPLRGELHALALDKQNVHTRIVVEETKKTVDIIRNATYIPEGYRWSHTTFSATPYVVSVACQLPPQVSVHLLAIYSSDTAIYDIEEGIYGKVLDSVWQYITDSPYKNDLCKILGDEIIDSVGMCAQGNLSRICNVLSGYLDGIKVKESTAEILGRVFPPLMNIHEKTERLEKAKKILIDYDVPQEQWGAWIEPLE